MKRKIFIALASIAFIFTLLSFSAYAAPDSDFEFDNPAGYYGREALLGLNNAEALVYAYDKISEGVASSAAEIQIYNGKSSISQEEARMALDAYRRDRGEHFWLGNSYTVSYNQKTVLSIKPTYIMEGSALTEAKEAYLSAANEILSGVKAGMSEFEIELYLHDALAERVTYVESANAHNSYGAIVEGKAVCEGYAEAMQYLLGRCGIRSFIAVGTSKNPGTGASEGHAWNIVRIDGKYYHLDLTWNDQEEKTYHAYFNLTDTVITEDHVIENSGYPIPVCNSTEAMYFNVRGGVLPAGNPSVSEIASMLKAGGLVASVYASLENNPQGPEAFINWYYRNIRSIATAAGVNSSFSYGYSCLGREIMIVIETCPHTSLKKIDPVPEGCTEKGAVLHYECTCGKLFWDDKAKQPIENKYDIVIEPTGHTPALDYEYDSSYHWNACIDCDGQRLNRAYHTYDNSCDTECNICGAARNITHTYSSSCDADCNVCGAERNITHRFSESLFSDADGHFHKCICGQRQEVLPHTDENGDGACDVCNYRVGYGSSSEEEGGSFEESDGSQNSSDGGGYSAGENASDDNSQDSLNNCEAGKFDADELFSGNVELFGYEIDKKILLSAVVILALIVLPVIFKRKK